MKKVNLLIAGIGGQGIILASDLLGEAAMAMGYDVKKTDTIGMAQRGGSVVSHIRIAPQVWSPIIKDGEVDLILAFEKLEAARWSSFLRPGGIVIVNNHSLPPLSITLGKERYPSDEAIIEILSRYTNHIYFVDGTNKARELGNIKSLNVFMLGSASPFIPISIRFWQSVIFEHLPAKIRQVNVAAFEHGRRELRDVHI
ncbi:indolepyruvate oxidoreductase subunit beta [Chloroflexota bacterium]